MTSADVLFEVQEGQGGNLALITLNRPQALNALTHEMCLLIEEKLRFWETDPAIKVVVMQGAGEKAFCAGGDIRSLYDLGKQQQYAAAMVFFHDEYRLNYLISHYTKPYIALMDGITMGGGVGLSVHGAYRVGTERLVMAMPETGIGFFPDIGGTYFLSRCGDELGVYLGLTGDKIDAGDAIYSQLIDYVIPSHHLNDVLNTLLTTEFNGNEREKVEIILANFNVTTERSNLYAHREMIKQAFSHSTMELIILALQEHKTAWHVAVLEKLQTKSPTSLAVTLEALRRGVELDLNHCLDMEYNLCSHFIRGHDFYEGVRALLLDKDKTPHWQPAKLDELSREKVLSYFDALT